MMTDCTMDSLELPQEFALKVLLVDRQLHSMGQRQYDSQDTWVR